MLCRTAVTHVVMRRPVDCRPMPPVPSANAAIALPVRYDSSNSSSSSCSSRCRRRSRRLSHSCHSRSL